MTTQRLSSQAFDITIGDIAVNVTSLTLDITDNTTIEVFGCKLVLTSLLNIDNSNSPTQSTVKVDFMVTASDFVRINGIPYLAQDNLPSLN